MSAFFPEFNDGQRRRKKEGPLEANLAGNDELLKISGDIVTGGGGEGKERGKEWAAI